MKNSLFVFAFALVACSPPAARAPDAEHARAGLVQMQDGILLVGHECTVAANAQHSDALYNWCVNTLIPARDAVTFADGPRKIACAGVATEAALTELCSTLPCDARVQDAIVVARELGTNADARCDPKHPTTEVSFTEDPSIPRVEPNYPRSIR